MKKIILLILTVFGAGALLFAFQGDLFAWGCFNDYGYRGGHHFFGRHFLSGGSIMFYITILLLGVAGFFTFKYFKLSHKNIKLIDDDNSIEILKTRFAKGEITKEEFEEMKKTLS